MLKVDWACDPFNTPLADSLDFVHRLQHWATLPEAPRLRATSIYFIALYTNFVWTDVLHACSYWCPFLLHRLDRGFLSPNEVVFVSWLLSPISMEVFTPLPPAWLFLSIPHSHDLSLGLPLFSFVWNHDVFHTPTEGIYWQAFGFSMGTNCTAPWANLILRFYEKKHCFDRTDRPRLWVFRFIDDVCLIHLDSFTPQVIAYTRTLYPAHLPFTINVTGSTGDFNFVDVRVVSLSPLLHCVHFKATHTCNDIPFKSDTPLHVHRGWIHGECVRYLHLNSHPTFYTLCRRRLHLALLRLGYRIFSQMEVGFVLTQGLLLNLY